MKNPATANKAPRMGIEALSHEGLLSLCDEWHLPTFRAKQLEHWLYGKAARSYDDMTNLPQTLREKLAEEFPFVFPSVEMRKVSQDGTRKYLVRFHDGTLVETVALPTKDRLTVCFSTQAGCGMGCTFCATGKSGLVRSLLPGEMLWQLLVVADDFGQRISNAVAMGQGEPFANYDATLAALRFINSPNALGVGARHLTLSTCGLIPGIQRFTQEPEQFTLAVSLHSAVQATRNRLMPGVAGFPLDALRAACLEYSTSTGRRPTFEYALLAGENDSDAECAALVDFCSGMLSHVNLIPANTIDGSSKRVDPKRVSFFQKTLEAHGIETSLRTPRGVDIEGACGQLRQQHRKDPRETAAN